MFFNLAYNLSGNYWYFCHFQKTMTIIRSYCQQLNNTGVNGYINLLKDGAIVIVKQKYESAIYNKGYKAAIYPHVFTSSLHGVVFDVWSYLDLLLHVPLKVVLPVLFAALVSVVYLQCALSCYFQIASQIRKASSHPMA